MLLCVCPVRECNETDVKLVSGQTPNDGQVEICLDGGWRPICDDNGWDLREIKVVCRQLGYDGREHPFVL